jgi:hypothetical protein
MSIKFLFLAALTCWSTLGFADSLEQRVQQLESRVQKIESHVNYVVYCECRSASLGVYKLNVETGKETLLRTVASFSGHEADKACLLRLEQTPVCRM